MIAIVQNATYFKIDFQKSSTFKVPISMQTKYQKIQLFRYVRGCRGKVDLYIKDTSVYTHTHTHCTTRMKKKRRKGNRAIRVILMCRENGTHDS